MNRHILHSVIPNCVGNDGVARERFLAALGMTTDVFLGVVGACSM